MLSRLLRQAIIADLMERQTRTKVAEDEVGYIGISAGSNFPDLSRCITCRKGIYVVSVEEGSASSANAGIMKSDIITKFDYSISSYFLSSEDCYSTMQPAIP